MVQAPCRIAIAILIACVCWDARAEFGSVPITPSASVKAPVSTAPKTQVTAPSAAPSLPTAAPAVPSAPVGKKWFQHESGYVIVVDADQVPGAGFKEVPPPVQVPAAAPVAAAPAAVQPSYQAPATPAYTQPQVPATYTNPAFSQPPAVQAAPQIPAYTMPPAAATTGGVPPGKKWMQHKSGYRVIVDQNTMPSAEFVDIPPPNTAPAMQPGYAPGQPAYAPQTPQVPPSAFAQTQGYAPQTGQSPQTYSQIPITGQVTPARPYTGTQQQLSNIPPNLQRQLPYQPPTPPGMMTPQVPYQQPGQMNYGANKPVVRSAPPGQKWLQGDNGMRYLVGVNTIPGPGFREISDEEASQPIRLGAPPGQQQQQQPQQQSGFMSWLNNLGK